MSLQLPLGIEPIADEDRGAKPLSDLEAAVIAREALRDCLREMKNADINSMTVADLMSLREFAREAQAQACETRIRSERALGSIVKTIAATAVSK